LRVKRRRRRVKRTRGGGINVTTSQLTRGNQEGRRQQTRGSGASKTCRFVERTRGGCGTMRGIGITSRGTRKKR